MTRLETATLACARNAELSTTELFSGYTTESILVDATTRSFSRTITLNRAVAGILLYVEYIPATLPVHACDSEDRSSLRHVAVRSLAVVHGRTLSDQVLIARREAVAGRLTVATAASAASSAASADAASVDSQSGSSSTLPFPRYVLLRADIPAQAQVQNGFYVNISPENTAHPHALLKGSFVMPQQANVRSARVTEPRRTTRRFIWFFLVMTPTENGRLHWNGAPYDSQPLRPAIRFIILFWPTIFTVSGAAVSPFTGRCRSWSLIHPLICGTRPRPRSPSGWNPGGMNTTAGRSGIRHRK